MRRHRLIVATASAMATLILGAGPAGAATYVVKPGDTLSGIARRHGVSTADLLALNPQVTDPNLVRIGSSLTVPDGAAAAAAPSPPATEAQTVRHTVAKGETLSSIARRYGVSVTSITSRNGISNPNLLRVGATLTIEIVLGGKPTYPTSLRRDPQRLALVEHFDRAAAEFGVPHDLLKSMCWYESGWRAGAISSAGAIGVGQLMPGTAAFVAEQMGEPRLDPYDPVDNIRMSAWYLAYLLDRYDRTTRQALMAYNQGWKQLETKGPTKLARSYADTIIAQRPWW